MKTGPTGKPIRKFEMPKSLTGKIWVLRYLILRRISQFTVLLLFFGTAHWGWSVGGEMLLNGNLSSSEFLGFLPMADPYAVLQILFSQHMLIPEVLLGTGLIFAFYALIGGRTFCAWVCPINPITDLAAWIRKKLDIQDAFYTSRRLRYWLLGLSLPLSFLTGLAAFEWISPIAMLHRELIYGIGFGWLAVLGLFLFDLLVLKHGWCGHLCPLGAFYAIPGRYLAQLRVRYDVEKCTHCGECTEVCPEPHVLNLKRAAQYGFVISGECTNCGRCTPVCPEDALSFDLRALIGKHQKEQQTTQTPKAA